MKHCPKCPTRLLIPATAKRYGAAVDFCPACKGIWFDREQLEMLMWSPGEAMAIPRRARRSPMVCPACTAKMRRFVFPRTMVGVEMCPACGGLWLTDGEFKEITTVVGHLRRSGVVVSDRPAWPGLKASLLNLINGAISSLSGW